MTDKIRLLIVDDSAETREHLTKLLSYEPDMNVAGWAATGEEALEHVARLPVDVVLLDINMPGMGGIATAEQLAERAPATAIVVMSVQNESSYLRSAMRAGAREFLVKPFSADDLNAAIRQAHQHRRDLLSRVAGLSETQPHPTEARPSGTPAGKVVSLFAAKGGVGRTTLAVNLAVAAAGMGKRVALVDGCLQFGDVGMLLNLDPRARSVADAARMTADDDDPLGALTTHSSGVQVLLAPPSPELADTIAVDGLVDIIRRLRNSYELVIVDAPASLGDTTLALLDASDVILCVLTLEITAIKNARHFVHLAGGLGYPPTKIELLLNRADAGLGIGVSEAEQSLGQKIVHTVVSDGRTVVSALNRGEPFVTVAGKAKVSQDVTAIARHLTSGPVRAVAAPVPEHKQRRAFAWRAR